MTGKQPTDPSGTAEASRPVDAGRDVSAETGDLAPRGEPPSFSPGEWLADRFQIERLLGRGSMGEVYAVRDDELAILVALKTLPLSLSQDPDSVLRLKREVLLARSVAHPHVCRVFDVGRHGEGADVGPDSELGRELAGLRRMLAAAHER